MDAPREALANGRRRRLIGGAGLLAAAPLLGCGNGDAAPAPAPTPAPRRWRMGFSPTPPRFSVDAVIQGIDLWSRRAELAIIHEELPWTELLAGQSPESILDRDKLPLVRYLRSKGLQLVFMGELNDGLARELDAPQLRAQGRSIVEPAVQQLYRRYMLAVDRVLQPRWLGLVAESNLIRAAAPDLYPSIRRAANDAAADLRAAGSGVNLVCSVQVETAWGRLGGPVGPGGFVGIETDFSDFPFVQTLGLSSYPYFGWRTPEELPTDYYQRLRAGRGLPLMVLEGGWASAGVGSLASSPAMQVRYVERHAELLDAAGVSAWMQLVFADIDLAAVPAPVPANLPLFVSIGLADSLFQPKPALAAWDRHFARPLAAG